MFINLLWNGIVSSRPEEIDRSVNIFWWAELWFADSFITVQASTLHIITKNTFAINRKKADVCFKWACNEIYFTIRIIYRKLCTYKISNIGGSDHSLSYFTLKSYHVRNKTFSLYSTEVLFRIPLFLGQRIFDTSRFHCTYWMDISEIGWNLKSLNL